MLGGGVVTVSEGVPLPFMGKARPVLALRLPLSCRDQALGRPQLSLAAKVIAMRFPTEFLIDESGAVTVDWVVLAAAVVGLGVGTVGAVRSGALSMGNDISSSLSNAAVVSLGELGADGYAGPWVSQAAYGGRGMAWVEDGACDKSGNCTPSTSYVVQSYEIDNGEIWTRTVSQVDGADEVEIWTNADGDQVDAPRFPA